MNEEIFGRTEEIDDATGGTPVIPPPPGYLTPVAYLWTRTVRCKNPSCGATVPLVKQTWLCKKKDRYVALKIVAGSTKAGGTGGPPVEKKVRFEVVEATTEKDLGFDPTAGSKGGNATCLFCGAVVDSDYVKAEGQAGRIGQQAMAVVGIRQGKQGKVYLSADEVAWLRSDETEIRQRIAALCERTGLTVPDEPIEARMTGGICLPYGLTDFGKLFTQRQMLCLLTFAAAVREAYHVMGQASSLSGTGKMPVPPDKDAHSSMMEQANKTEKMVGQASSLSGTGKMPVPPEYEQERAKAVTTISVKLSLTYWIERRYRKVISAILQAFLRRTHLLAA